MVAVPLVLTIIAWLMLWDAGKVYDVSPPNFFAVLPRMLLLHLVAARRALGPRLWKALAKRFGFPRMLVDAAVTALRYLGALSAVAALFCHRGDRGLVPPRAVDGFLPGNRRCGNVPSVLPEPALLAQCDRGN